MFTQVTNTTEDTMKGSIVRRGSSFSLVIDRGYATDDTGKRNRTTKWITFRPTAKHTDKCSDSKCSKQCKARTEAEAKLAEVISKIDNNTYVDASKTTVVDYLRLWHKSHVVAPYARPETIRVYSSMIETHVAGSPIANLPLQRLTAGHLEGLYASLKLSASSISILHAIFTRSLRLAVRDKVLAINPAVTVESRPKVRKDRGAGARLHCWTPEEARRAVATAEGISVQVGTFMALAIDCGARRSELLGLRWRDFSDDLTSVTIAQQLERGNNREPAWGPTKTKTTRTLALGDATVAKLRAHRKQQRELAMKNRNQYSDCGLAFAKEPADQQRPGDRLGEPCPALAARYFHQVTKAAGVRRIRFHGLRHTCATLLLTAGEPIKTVSERLGHSTAGQTLAVYLHAQPGAQVDAAATMNAIMTGSR